MLGRLGLDLVGPKSLAVPKILVGTQLSLKFSETMVFESNDPVVSLPSCALKLAEVNLKHGSEIPIEVHGARGLEVGEAMPGGWCLVIWSLHCPNCVLPTGLMILIQFKKTSQTSRNINLKQ